MDRGVWWAIVHGDAKELDTAEPLSTHSLSFEGEGARPGKPLGPRWRDSWSPYWPRSPINCQPCHPSLPPPSTLHYKSHSSFCSASRILSCGFLLPFLTLPSFSRPNFSWVFGKIRNIQSLNSLLIWTYSVSTLVHSEMKTFLLLWTPFLL